MNFDTLNQKLMGNALSLLSEWLPGGKKSGNEYECGSWIGGPGKSFKVNLKTGLWAEFAGDLKGGDLISLYAAIQGLSQGESYIALGGEKECGPSLKHPKHGFPSVSWCYLSRSGTPLMYIARYDTPEGKTFLPWTSNNKGWHSKSLPAPRPLYGLELLDSKPFVPVLICEGEKACEAARKLAPEFLVMTWPHGAKGVTSTDWKPLAGRMIVLWPDADEPGVSAMKEIARLLRPECQWIKILDVSNHSDGWDAYDALASGFTRDQLYAWMGETPELPPLEITAFNAESMAQLLARPEPSLDWRIESIWVDNSRGLIAGNPGIGKTWLALDMLLAVSSGQLCLGKYAVRQAPVLLVEEEASLLNLARRVHTMARGRNLKDTDLTNFFHITRQFLKIPTHEKELVAYIKNRGIKLVVFDSLRRFHGADENSSEKMQPVLDSFARINIDAGCSVVLIHHLSKKNDKGDKRPVFERMRGTSDLWAWRDCIIGMEGEEEATDAICNFQFRDAESTMPIKVKRFVNEASGSITLGIVGMEESEEFMERSAAILTWMKAQFVPQFKNTICSKAGGRKAENTRIFNLMASKNIVLKDGTKWRIGDVPE